MNILTESLVEETIQAVQEAGACLSDPTALRCVRTKSKTDYVTNVDLAVQELLRERLAALAPDVQFMGEEQDNTGLDWSRPCWILDGGVLHCPPRRRSVPKRSPHPCQQCLPAGGQPSVRGHCSRPPGAGGHRFPADAGAL